MDGERGPLAVQNGNQLTVKPPVSSKLVPPGSRLPQPGSRLKPPSGLKLPGFGLKPPTAVSKMAAALGTNKRKGSPPNTNPQKKAKVETANVSIRGRSGSVGSSSRPGTKPQARSNPPTSMLRRSASTGSINKTAASTGRPAPASRNTVQRSLSNASSTAKGKAVTGRAGVSSGGAPKVGSTAGGGAGAATGGKKRAAWDLKGRLLDMEAAMSKHLSMNVNLEQSMAVNEERIAQLEQINNQLEGTVAQKEEQTKLTSQEVEKLQKKLRMSEEELTTITRELQRKIEDLEYSKAALARTRDALEGDLASSRQEVLGLKGSVASLTSAQAGIRAELDSTKMNLEAALEDGRMKASTIQQLRETVAQQECDIAARDAKIREDEMARRKLHNTIQELKGNIRVFCRVRPLLGEECQVNGGDIHHIHFPDEDHKMVELDRLGESTMNESVMNRTVANNKNAQSKYEFTFDRVFQPYDSQATVFEEISQLVQSALDGYNVCIFAYGQTGSGKTHTMEGGARGDLEQVGMIPRAVEQIFLTASELQDKGWSYEFESSFLEIYNESIRDLLGNGKDDVKHEVKMVSANSTEVQVTNMTMVKVNMPDEVQSLLKRASENRAVAETKCNERSSRSHSIFRLKITGHNQHTDDTCVGLLNLIDLAGSERLKDSGSQGQRLKETQSINKSLANLGNVIMALANKDSHIPYRNSKLTHVLQSSLGGNSKTLMFVNVSPKEECFNETLNSLRFATKVNNCNIGTATRKGK